MPPQSQIAERIYYDEQQCSEFTADVTEIRELARVEGKPVFQLALDRTAFYPTSGGQPHDIGVLIATARSGAVLEAPIDDVVEDDLGEVWHTTAKPLQPGTVVQGRIDSGRRRDHMQQHSGQHLLSAIAASEFGALTVSFHLGDAVSAVDLAVPSLEPAQLERLEQLVNDAVAAALPIRQQVVSSEEARRLLETGVLRKLPPREGPIRIICIGDIDHNACGGTHVANTAHIGPVLLRRTERVRGNLRLAFVCGTRAIRSARHEWQTLSGVASSLSTSAADLPHRIAKMQAEIKSLRKQLRDVAPAASA